MHHMDYHKSLSDGLGVSSLADISHQHQLNPMDISLLTATDCCYPTDNNWNIPAYSTVTSLNPMKQIEGTIKSRKIYLQLISNNKCN